MTDVIIAINGLNNEYICIGSAQNSLRNELLYHSMKNREHIRISYSDISGNISDFDKIKNHYINNTIAFKILTPYIVNFSTVVVLLQGDYYCAMNIVDDLINNKLLVKYNGLDTSTVHGFSEYCKSVLYGDDIETVDEFVEQIKNCDMSPLLYILNKAGYMVY